MYCSMRDRHALPTQQLSRLSGALCQNTLSPATSVTQHTKRTAKEPEESISYVCWLTVAQLRPLWSGGLSFGVQTSEGPKHQEVLLVASMKFWRFPASHCKSPMFHLWGSCCRLQILDLNLQMCWAWKKTWSWSCCTAWFEESIVASLFPHHHQQQTN